MLCLAKKKKQNDSRLRGIILFTARFYSDAVLEAVRKNMFLQSHGLSVAKHLNPEDIETKNKLWPTIKKA
jgi:hypothetical protein